MKRPLALVTTLAAALLVPLTAPAVTAAPEAAAPLVRPAAAPAQAGEELDVVDLASRYSGSHLRYRIPALTTLPNGDLLAVYDGRPTMNDLPSNIALLMRRSTDGGQTWQEPEVIRQDPPPNGYGDPSVLVDREAERVFVFYAASINQGYAGSATGNDPDDPDVLHPDFSYSDDNGVTWEHVRITEQIKDPAWGGMFAASGEGIQLRHGEHAGRLIQQYTVRHNGANYAMSAYSDDHGETWHAGELVGPGADENKTVELADGRVMLNSRAAPHRLLAFSEDGGESYTSFAPDTELIDPANNGSVIRAFPDAEPDDPRAQVLLFSNTEDTGIRRNLTVKMSCDSGETWPVRKVVEPDAAGYSTLTPLGDGTSDEDLGGSYGLLFEREGYRHISYTSFDLDWLEGACAPLTVEAPETLLAGQASPVSVTVTNQGQAATEPGTVTIDEHAGWTAEAVDVPAIPAGESTTVTLAVTPPAEAASRSHEVSVRYRTDGTSSSAVVGMSVLAGTTVVDAAGPFELDNPGDASAPAVDVVDLSDEVDAVAGLDSGAISVTFSTTSRSAVEVLLAASDSSSGVKDVILSLNGGQPYLEVRTAQSSWPVRIQNTGRFVDDGEQHTLVVVSDGATTRMLLDGEEIGSASSGAFFSAVTDLDSLYLGGYAADIGMRWGFTGTIHDAAVLGPVTPAPSLEVLPVLDAMYTGGADGLLDDQIAPWIRIRNTGNVPLTNITLAGPDNSASCNRTNALAPGADYVCKSVRHTITESDLGSGQWAPTFTATATAPDGTTTQASARLSPVDLTEPADPDATTRVWVPSGDFAASSFVRVPRTGSDAPALPTDRTLQLQVPVAGRASAQLAVTAPQGLEGLSASGSALTGPDGATIPADALQVRYPQYIPDLVNGGVVADPLREVDAVDVGANQNQPVWFTLEVPSGTAPGAYEGTVTVSADDGELGSWPLQVDVPDVTLRDMDDRPFVLDLWAQPDSVAAQLDLELWSEEHWDALRPYLRDLADHGQEVVNVAIIQDPWMVNHEGEWRAQTQDAYNSTVEWLWDGEEFTFDFSVFDRYVTESREAGIGDTIHAFAMLQFHADERFTYTDTRTGETVVEIVELGDERYREGWTAFLQAFKAHLDERGWFEDTRLAFDERPIATMNVAFDVIEEAEPAWSDKVALAANSLAEADIADYISFNYSFLDQVPDSLIQERLAQGEPTLFYTFYDPQRPNTVTASPPVSTRVLGWVVEQRDLDGYLRWTYNSWPTNVYEDPSFRYGQGDEYLVYPGQDGPVSSTRWELFRDGQDDAELLNLAKEQLGEDSPVVTEALEAIDPRAEDLPQTWATMLQQEADVRDAMAAQDGVSVSAAMEVDTVGAGGTAAFSVDVTAGEAGLEDLSLDLSPRPEGTVHVTPPGATDLGAGESATWDVVVDVPEDARNLTIITGRVVDGSGQVVGSFTLVPLVGEAVAATGPIVADPASSRDTQEPVVLTVPVRNISATAETVTLTASDLDFWRAEAVEVEVPANSEVDVTLELFPDGGTGWSTVTATLTQGDSVLAGGSFDIVSGGVHVSDLEWVSETNGWGPVERDMSVGEDEAGDGNVMTIGGREYSKGVGVHAVSRITIDVAGQCTTFSSDYGIDDEVAGAASVTFEVVGDGESLWRSDLVRPSSGAQYIDVDVTDVDTLELVVGDGGNGVAQDHANWAGAWLACEAPEVPTEEPTTEEPTSEEPTTEEPTTEEPTTEEPTTEEPTTEEPTTEEPTTGGPTDEPTDDPAPGELVLDGVQVRAGDTLGVSGGGFVPGETVIFTVGDLELGTATADAEGVVRAELVIPADLEPGTYELTATGADQVLTARFEVLAASVEPTTPGTDPTTPDGDATDGVPGGQGPGDLPDTGASVGAAAAVMLALLATGAVLVTRRRQAATRG